MLSELGDRGLTSWKSGEILGFPYVIYITTFICLRQLIERTCIGCGLFWFFFYKKKNHFSKCWISSILSTPMMPDGFWHFPGAMRVISGPQECSEGVQSGFTYEKHDFSVKNPLISPYGVRGLFRIESEWKSMVLGRQWELSGQLVIKFNRNHPKTLFLGL